MNNQIEKFDPSSLMQGVKDRIKATFVSLIPDDQWEKLCEKEVHSFFEDRKETYSHREYKSDFQMTCRTVLNEIAKEKITEALKSYDSSIWNNNQLVINEELKKVLIANASEILISMIGSQVQAVINNMKQRGY